VNPLGRLLSQSGRPRGWFGRILVRGMNLGHSGLTRWGLSKVEIPEHAKVEIATRNRFNSQLGFSL